MKKIDEAINEAIKEGEDDGLIISNYEMAVAALKVLRDIINCKKWLVTDKNTWKYIRKDLLNKFNLFMKGKQ